jgi:Domain of unknown function (DUF4145)
MSPENRGSDPDRLPDSTDPNGPCPRCGRVANFTSCGTADVTFKHDGYAVNREGSYERIASQQVAILECSGCRDRIVVVEDLLVGGIRGGRSGNITWEGIHWWPIPGAGESHPSVPAKVADAYAEGIRCLSAGAPNGAVAMFRTAMTWIVDDKGSTEAKAKGDLKEKVKQMVMDGGFSTPLGDWVSHVRLYGNAAVHPDLFGDVSVDEARDVARLTETLIELLYITPAKVAQRQAERLT